jgi:hypothetical protein
MIAPRNCGFYHCKRRRAAFHARRSGQEGFMSDKQKQTGNQPSMPNQANQPHKQHGQQEKSPGQSQQGQQQQNQPLPQHQGGQRQP